MFALGCFVCLNRFEFAASRWGLAGLANLVSSFVAAAISEDPEQLFEGFLFEIWVCVHAF